MKRLSILIVLVLLIQIFFPQSAFACKPEIDVTPMIIDFGSVPEHSMSAPRTVTVSNTGTAGLVISSISIGGDYPTQFIITSDHSVPKVIPSCSSYTYTLKFAPDSVGYKTAKLIIYSNDGDEKVVCVTLIGTGTIVCKPDISVNRTSINFGDVLVGSNSTIENVTVTNNGTANLTIGNLTISDIQFKISGDNISGDTLIPNASANISLVFKPAATGVQSANLTIPSNVPNKNVYLSGNGTSPDISVDPETVDFEDVPVGTQSEKTVTVTNEGTADLIIGNLTISDTQFALADPDTDNISGMILGPGAWADINLIFTPAAAGAQTGKLTITSNDLEDSPLDVPLYGNATKPEISVDPDSVDFEDVPVGTQSEKTVTVTNEGTADLIIGNLTINDPQFALADPITDNISGMILGPGAWADINLVFIPAATGPQTGKLTITSNDLEDSPLDVPLYGNATVPLISVDHESLPFGDVLVGTTSDPQTVRVTNVGTADLTIGNLTISDPQFALADPITDNISGMILGPGDSADINLIFTPAATGHKTGELTIPSNDPGKATLDIDLSGNGIAPEITVSQTSLPFGVVLVGTTSDPLTVRVTNDGSADLTIGNLTISDPQFTLDDPITDNISGQILAPHTWADINIVFTPTVKGQQSANLTITSDDANESRVDVELTGYGKAEPNISVDPTSLNFHYVQKNTPSDQLTVTVTNTGNAKLIISDLEILDTHFVIVSDGVTTLDQGGSAIITIVFTPTAADPYSTNLTITSNDPDQPTLDVPLSGHGTEGPPAPDIMVSRTLVDFDDWLVGTTSTPQDVTVSNNGTANLNIGTLTISDPQFALAELTDNISDTILEPDTSAVISLVFSPTAAGGQSADLTIPSDAASQSTVTVQLTGNGTVLTTDLEITKTGNLDTIAFGDNLIYTVTVTNHGPDNATGVVVTDTLPAQLNYVSSSIPAPSVSVTDGNITWNIGGLNNDASATLDIVVTLKPFTTASTIKNIATVSGKESDPDETNNTASENTGVRSADLQITKTDFPDPIGYTGNVTWVVTVTNNSTENASNVVVIDTYPSLYSTIQSTNGTIILTAPQWLKDYAMQTGLPILTPPAGELQLLWDIGDLASGASVQMRVVATANFTLPPSPFELRLLALMGPGLLPNYILPNSALVLSTLADPNFNNNTAYTITSTDPGIPYADLAITKIGNPDPVVPGDNVTYTVTIRNNGTENATGVFVLDGWLKSELSLQSAVTSTGTANQTLPPWLIDAINPGGTPPADVDFLYWYVGDLANGDNATLTITASANASVPSETTIVNFAVVSAPVLDANPTNNYAWSATSIAQADLAIIKTDSPDPVIAGDNLTYTLTVTNNGPGNATGVIVTDTLPATTTYLSDTPSTGTTDNASGTVTWNIGSLAYGASANLTIVVKAPPSMGVITNNARVSGHEVDILTLNNTAITATFVVPFGDLPDIDVVPTFLNFGSITLNSPSSPMTVTVNNKGTAPLVIDKLTISNGEFFISSGDISGQTLAPHASATISLIFTPAATGIQLASLSIPSNDPDESLVVVALSGYGTIPLPPPGPPPGPPGPPEPTPTPTPTPEPELQYFTVDFLGLITKAVATSDGRPASNMAAPSPDGLHLLEIEALTGASVNANTVTLIEIREAQAPQLPENTELVGKAYEFKPSGTVFDKPIKLTLGYNVNELPEGVISVGAAYYTSQDGWTYLDTESTSVAELGKLTAAVNHFTVFAVLATVPAPQPEPTPEPTPTPTPTPAPAQFNLSNLTITTSVSRIWEKLTYVIRTGEEAVITADITNGGGQTGAYTAVLIINGTERERKEITLEPGQTGTVSFTVTGNDEGTYTVLIGSLTGDFLSDLWINWWLIVATIAVLILIAWLVWYIIQRRKRREAPTTNQ
jgi:uncharacterized repeat protein (TIGR01451 family)